MRPVIFLLFGLLAASSNLVQGKAEPEEGVRWALGLDLRTRVYYSAGLKGGIGVAWKPFERVGLFVSQGVEVQFKKNDFPSYKIVASLPKGLTYYRSDTWSAGLSEPGVVAFWMF